MTRKAYGRNPGQICYHKSGTPFRLIHRDPFIGADLSFIRAGARQSGHPFAGALERELTGRHHSFCTMKVVHLGPLRPMIARPFSALRRTPHLVYRRSRYSSSAVPLAHQPEDAMAFTCRHAHFYLNVQATAPSPDQLEGGK
jgi:hypothetical protein